MYGKLASRNIRRSLRDYGIYFLTLVFAVAIFYVFNSLVDQPAFLTLNGSTRRMALGMLAAMEWLTVIMTGVVGLLVLYANRVIIKKRSRELGTYLLLGMEQGRLAFLLMTEITVIGMAALLVGLVGGIFLSQFFALVVNRLLAADLTGHAFVFSPTATVRTLICYGLTFVLVGLWQAAAVYRQTLIDLITGVRKNEQIRLRSRLLALATGVMTALTLGLAYWLSDQISRNGGLSPRDPRIGMGVLLGVVGTYLLFAALAGLLSRVRGRPGGWLTRGLNLFLYRQVTNKISTNATLLATITLMLTFTICAMSFGLGLGRGVADGAEQEAPFDYMLVSASPTEEFQGVLTLFDQHGITERTALRIVTAQADLRDKELMLPEDARWFEGARGEFVAQVRAQILPVSAYRELRALKGYPEVELPEESYLIHASALQDEPQRRAREAYQRFLASGSKVALAGRQLSPGSTQVFTDALGGQLSGAEALLVVPDSVATALPAHWSYMVVEVAGQVPEELHQAVLQLAQPSRLQQQTGDDGIMMAVARADVVGSAYLIEGMLLFLTFYIGVMFILISATLLALQQVTDAVEHRQRFQVLRKLGADEPMIDGVIARQLGLYFLTPVAVALMHSLVAMTALARLFSSRGFTTVWPATLVTLGIFGLIYGTYYLLSLQSCRALFKEAEPQ